MFHLIDYAKKNSVKRCSIEKIQIYEGRTFGQLQKKMPMASVGVILTHTNN